MAMVVECESCRSRFLLNESLLKESKAVRFRCRKCGGSIMVRNPHATPSIPVSAVSAEIAAPPTAADISPVIRAEIGQPPPREIPVPSKTVLRLEDLLHLSPGKDLVPLKASIPRKPFPGRNIRVAGLSILLLAGVVLYIGSTEAGQDMLGKWFPSWGSAPQASAAARPAYDVRELKSTAQGNKTAGNLFVVSGTVVNVGKGASRGIQMRAALLGGDNQVLMENTSLAGNLIDEPTLHHMKRITIEVYLKMERRDEGENRYIPPGKSLPFMVVFFDPPEKIGSFTVHAVDAD
jgi:predicted RNA-binding Zn-ribbon protein involved in translation (DUF1610 family)